MNEPIKGADEPSELFKEYRSDIMLFLDKHEESFKSSYNEETANEAKVAQFHKLVRSYKTQLQEKLNVYTKRLAEFQQFCNNFKNA